MRLKSYQANSVEAAIRLAKVELGEDAIFMGSRENGCGEASGARYEVTFAVVAADSRSTGGPAVGRRNGSVDGHGQPGLSRPAWTGLARRALGHPKRTSPAKAEQPRKSISSNGPQPGGAHRHWKDFLPPELRPAPPAVPARTESRSAGDGIDRGESSRVGGGSYARVTVAQSEVRLTAGIENLSPEADRFRDVPGEEQKQVNPLATGPGTNNALDLVCSNGIELLISQGMCSAVARKLLDEALSGCSQPVSTRNLQRQLEASITRDCRVEATLGGTVSSAGPTVVAFVGPPGVGKTTTICKLAVRVGLQADRPVHLVALDQYRLGASEQLESFASLLDAPFIPAEDGGEAVEAVRRALACAQTARPPLILIDTPGYAPADWKHARSLAGALSGLPGLDTHVVVAATSSEGHLRRSLDAYRIFHPRKLLITKLDECVEAGAIIGEALRSRLPISYFATGQRIPEDIAAANPGRLAQQLLQAF